MKKFVGKKWEYDDYGDIYTYIDNNRKNIACTWHLDYSPEELQANTRLIAAAPEMYATLERCLGYIGALSKKTEYGFLDKLEKDITELLTRIDGTEDENE